MSYSSRSDAREAPTTEIAGTIVAFRGEAIVINDGTRNVQLPLSLLQFFKSRVQIGRPTPGETYDIELPEWLARKEGLI